MPVRPDCNMSEGLVSVEILVPLDGSAAAEHALPAAVAAAKRSNGTLHLCRVCPPPGQTLDGERVSFERSLRERMRALTYLETVRERVGANFGGPVGACLRSGPPAESILREAHLIGAELIVLTAHGRRPTASGWIGPTADQVVHRADCPVLLLPPGRGLVDWSAGTYSRVLLPVENAVGVGAVLAGTPVVERGPHVTCCLLQVAAEAADATGGVGVTEDKWPACAAEVVEALATYLEERGQRTLSRSAEGNPPLEAIIRSAWEFDAELILLGLPAKRGFHSEWLGALAEQLTLMAPLPLLLHRPVSRRVLTLPGLGLPSPDDGAAEAAS